MTKGACRMMRLTPQGLGCGVVPASYRTRCPSNVVLRQVDGLDVIKNLEIVYRADNRDPVLSNFLSDLRAATSSSR